MDNNIEIKITEENELFQKYIESLTDIEKKALSIAIRNLETSFSLEKSIGYIEWLKKYKADM